MFKETIIINENDLSKYNGTNYIDSGFFSNVYYYDQDKVIKLWKHDMSINIVHTIEKLTWIDMKFKTLIIPEQLVCLKTNLGSYNVKGYISDYFAGKTYDSVVDNIKFSELLNALFDLDEDLESFAKYKFLIKDCRSRNILCNIIADKVFLALIDVDLWQHRNNLSSQEILESNINTVAKAIIEVMKSDLFLSLYFKQNPQLLYNVKTMSELKKELENIKESIENTTNQEIITMGDFKKVLRKIV